MDITLKQIKEAERELKKQYDAVRMDTFHELYGDTFIFEGCRYTTAWFEPISYELARKLKIQKIASTRIGDNTIILHYAPVAPIVYFIEVQFNGWLFEAFRE